MTNPKYEKHKTQLAFVMSKVCYLSNLSCPGVVVSSVCLSGDLDCTDTASKHNERVVGVLDITKPPTTSKVKELRE